MLDPEVYAAENRELIDTTSSSQHQILSPHQHLVSSALQPLFATTLADGNYPNNRHLV
jgi:hypothetical protein